MKLKIVCDWCGKEFERKTYKIKKHNFCCRRCLADFSNKTKNPIGYKKLKDYSGMSQHMKELNRKLNPMRMTDETRRKIHEARLDSGQGKNYRKYYGKHEHRVIAEKMLGRPLRLGEVVHHIDGNKRNNSESNLRIFGSQAEHAAFHKKLDAVLALLRIDSDVE